MECWHLLRPTLSCAGWETKAEGSGLAQGHMPSRPCCFCQRAEERVLILERCGPSAVLAMEGTAVGCMDEAWQ